MKNKRLTAVLCSILLLPVFLCGCEGSVESVESKLCQTWCDVDTNKPVITFYEDGTGDLNGEYIEWTLMGEDQLKITEYDFNIVEDQQVFTIYFTDNGHPEIHIEYLHLSDDRGNEEVLAVSDLV